MLSPSTKKYRHEKVACPLYWYYTKLYRYRRAGHNVPLFSTANSLAFAKPKWTRQNCGCRNWLFRGMSNSIKIESFNGFPLWLYGGDWNWISFYIVTSTRSSLVPSVCICVEWPCLSVFMCELKFIVAIEYSCVPFCWHWINPHGMSGPTFWPQPHT